MSNKTYIVPEELLLYITQCMRPLIPNIEGFDKTVKRIENLMVEQDRTPRTLQGGFAEIKQVLTEMFELMQLKGADYSENGNTFESFQTTGDFAGGNTDTAFRHMLGVKVARIRNLHKKPYGSNLNESIEESYQDLANYLVLYLAYQKYSENKK